MLFCAVIGRLCAPLIQRWDLGEILYTVWWFVCVMAGLALVGLFFGNPAGVPFVLLWIACAGFGLGVVLYGIKNDMDDSDKY